MPDLPNVTTTLTETGGGIGIDSDLLCVLSCTSSGTVDEPKRYRKHGDLVTEKGRGEGVDFAAHYMRRTNKSILFGKLLTATVAAIGPVDTKGVTGTSVVTYSGTPVDESLFRFEVVTGGTIGTAGIVFRWSDDGGRTWKANVRLGTATSYAFPNTGVTINFAAGTLIAGDYSTAFCSPPLPNAAGLTTMFNALAAQGALPPLILLCGDVPDRAYLDAVKSEIEAYETSDGRHARVICNVFDQYPRAVAQGTFTVTTTQGTKLYARSSGSWLTDGFKVGMTVTIAGFVNSASNGTKTIATVNATDITVVEAIGANEAAVVGTTYVAVETKSAHRTRVQVVIGATPPAEITAQRIFFKYGRGRRPSPFDNSQKRRPYAWWFAMRSFEHDMKVSPAKVADGPLNGVTIHDLNGILEDHDERVDGGVLAMRMGCMRTFDRPSGVYCALPLTLDTENAPLSRGPVGRVADLICQITKQTGTIQLNGEVELNSNGTIKEHEARRIEAAIETELKSNARGAEGVRWSKVQVILDRSPNLTVPGTKVPIRTKYLPLGYLEFLEVTVEVVTGTGE